MRFKTFALLALFFVVTFSFAQSTQANTNPKTLARQAVSENAKESAGAINSLRAMGQAGLDAMFETYAEEIKQYAAGNQSASWPRIASALDGVSQQRNSYASRLYWHTDLAKAEAEARKSGKPILSLRLLGNLNEEFSCANSRFFRTALYANKAVSDVLRERFVLHWKSVRPAPRVTIDYGDGRKLERTLTGNSIHYILDAEGGIVDALPGLYGPQGFLRGLTEAEAVVKQIAGQNDVERVKILNRYHRDRVDAITRAWTADAQKVGATIPESITREAAEGESFDARVAARTAMTKAMSENTIINAISHDVILLKGTTDEAAWMKIASLHGKDARLDEDSIALIRRQHANAKESPLAQEQLSRVVQNFERYLAFDTVRNEYTMHAQLHAWLASVWGRRDVESFNVKVYAELFLTPGTDPWLGLYSPDTYTALDGGGITK
ncbi:MAG: hypothetical protein H7Y30_06610 [Pyrinomonadaceae bacterium]|nr:hypothetical protein [Pyrinomonadaceae bacterium]